ncbi:SusC/RagA family TonB-linked outer membrane protein [uncultured Cyclobacterium sp.]|uniref:SusC/RagA family TonB-linked outer membrane protein n=1 Tax=uncultured Cyclobacterium sp. TaxID=453820 RepID=UPI0030EEBB7F|tara:strand:+ start:275881 stop:279426 length:3546 start_codon:yes stop_codon:yes gene_type:complete
MNKNVLRQLIMLSKRLLYAFLVQLFMCTILLANTGNAQRNSIEDVRLTLHIDGKSLAKFFRQVENKTEFKFTYNHFLVDLDQKVTVVDSNTVYKVLESISQQTQLSFVQVNENIHVKPAINKSNQGTIITQLADVTISGTIKDTKGEPIPGVTISLPGASIGTVTDLEGRYSLTIPEESTLVFSFIGYETQRIPIGGRSVIDVTLQEDISSLDEVVVVGYGTQKKESLVGAISKIEGDKVRLGVQGADLGTSLRGSTPGLTSMISTGVPGGVDYSGRNGENAQLLIRGQSTWNNSSPLVLVDGIERDILNVDPNAVASISVLKDASATAVFGVKGANGVILITTKRGSEGRAVVTFDSKTTFKNISRMQEGQRPADSYPAVQTMNNAILNEVQLRPNSWDFIYPQEWVEHFRTNEYPYYFPNVNWRDENLKDYTIDQTYNLSASGGTKFVKYFTTVSYLNETDMLKTLNVDPNSTIENDFKRLNIRSNLDFQLTPTTMFRVGLSGYFFDQGVRGGGDSAWRGVWESSPEIFPVKYPDGTYARDEGAYLMTNSVYDFGYSSAQHWGGTGLNTDFTLAQDLGFILKGLSVEAKLGYDNSSRTSGKTTYLDGPLTKYISKSIVDDPRFSANLSGTALSELEEEYTTWNIARRTPGADGYDWTPFPTRTFSQSILTNSTVRSILYQFQANYQADFGKHNVTGLALVSRAERTIGSVFPTYREDWVGRVTYGYDDRYLLEANAAYNGSEKFAPKYRFGFFPSAAIGWIVSNEAFFEPIRPIMNTLKFRYSNGKVGSDASIDRWLYTNSYIVNPAGGTGMEFGAPYTVSSPFPYRYEGTIANPDIQWETSHKIDYGIEAAFFDNRLLFTYDYFTEHRSNIFLSGGDRVLPAFYGADPVAANVGIVDIKGWEIETEFRNQATRSFGYWFKFGASYVIDNVVFKGDPELRPAYQKQEGFPMDIRRATLNQGDHSFYSTWNDIYNSVGTENNSDLLPGDFKTLDYNADGIINADDNVPADYPIRPQHTYSPSAGISFKNFSASIAFYGVYNLSSGLNWRYSGSSFGSSVARIANHYVDNIWSPELERFGEDAMNASSRFSSRGRQGFINYPRYYLRCENAEISYNITGQNVQLLEKLNISNARISLSGNNLFMFSPVYLDMDKVSQLSNVSDRHMYPVLRRVNLGMHLEF